MLQTNKKRGSFWQNVTGKVEIGETLDEGGLREAIEETGLKVENILDFIDLNLAFEFIDQRGRKVEEKCFLIILDKKWDVILDPLEHEHFKWVRIQDINSESVYHSSNFRAIEKTIHLLNRWGD